MSDDERRRVAWFGVPGQHSGSGVTHLVCEGRCICGTQQHPKAKEQFCAYEGMLMPECRKCQCILQREERVR
jgi:hypothetical protein